MKRPFSGLDLHFLIKELKSLGIEGGKIEKIYQLEKREFIFRIYTPNKKMHLRVDLDSFVHLTEKNYVTPKTPPGYAVFLRKYLTNARIKNIELKGLERLFFIEIETKTVSYKLIFELFNPGNVILTKEDIILNPLERQSFKTRIVKSKDKYEYPPDQIDIKNIAEEELKNMFLKHDGTIGKFLATDLGFGGLNSDEIIKRCDFKKDEPTKNCTIAIKEIKKLLDEKITPYICEGDAYPVILKTKKPEKEYETFSSALDLFFEIKEKKQEKQKKSEDKFDVVIKAQEKRAKNLEKEAIESQRQGEFLYEKYQEFQTLINKVNELKKTHSWIEIEEILKENKYVKNIDKKNKIINLEF